MQQLLFPPHTRNAHQALSGHWYHAAPPAWRLDSNARYVPWHRAARVRAAAPHAVSDHRHIRPRQAPGHRALQTLRPGQPVGVWDSSDAFRLKN